MYLILNIERTERHNRLYWWKASRRGYTTDISVAGRYSDREVKEICEPGEDIAIELGSISAIAAAKDALDRLTGDTHCDHARVEVLGPGHESDLMDPPFHCQGDLDCERRPVVRCLDCLRLCCKQHAGGKCPAPGCTERLLPWPFTHKGHVYG